MVQNLSRGQERRGTRTALMWGVAIIAALFVVLPVIFIVVPLGGRF
jgi:ABC-type Fe3+ transport system permease subunit